MGHSRVEEVFRFTWAIIGTRRATPESLPGVFSKRREVEFGPSAVMALSVTIWTQRNCVLDGIFPAER